MKTQTFISVITLLLLLTTSLQAGVIAGRWEKLDSQSPGKKIIVTLKTGDRMECDFKSSGADDLTVTDRNGNERRVPKSEVREIVSAGRIGDSLLCNGKLRAAVAGTIILIPLLYVLALRGPDVLYRAL